ncbi:MAG: baseplate J/gp47 family protein [Burkholderiaceae bacterium]|jgi:uncharacterized phage protein gp47/JayE|nr:baseplate J/gp47 family protein [Burkholderiaceae bacterium]
MTTQTNVPALNFGPGGVTAPTEAEILSGVLTDMNAAFGGQLNTVNLASPQGQLASSLTAIIGDKNSTMMRYVSQVDPLYAQGRMQDAIGRIYFLDRKPAQPTVVTVTCTGLAGVTIPLGALVSDSAGNVYACAGAGTIPPGGSIDLQFANQQTGPIPCAAGAIASIYQAIAGWDSAYNASDGALGNDVESAAEFEFRRQNSVALNAIGTLPSIYANVFAVPGVLDVYCAENTSNAPITQGATQYPLAPHSIYVAVVGGDPQEVARAIWLKKSVGADYNGNTTVAVQDTSGYEPPYPAYNVTFNIPQSVAIQFYIELANSPVLPSNILQSIQQAVINGFAGSDGGARARIGSTIYASRFYSAIMAIDPSVEIVSMQLGIGAATASRVQLGIDQSPTVSAADIQVALV